MFGHSDVPWFVSAQPVLMGFFPVSFQHWLMGTFSYTACFFTYCISSSRAFRTKTGFNSPLASSQYFLSRIEFSSCTNLSTFTHPTALLQYWVCQVEGLDLSSTRHVHQSRCVTCVANLLPKTLADLRVQILTTIGAFHLNGNMWAVREKLTRSPSRLSLALLSAWKTSCLHSKRIMHGRESCDASPLRSCKNQVPLLICSWYKTVEKSMQLAISDDKLRAFLADQPQNFALIFTITEVPSFAMLRIGSNIKDPTVHIQQEVVLCQWLRLFDVAAAGLLVLSILTFIVAQHPLPPSPSPQDFLNLVFPVSPCALDSRSLCLPSTNDPPFYSISAAKKLDSRLFEMSLNSGPP